MKKFTVYLLLVASILISVACNKKKEPYTPVTTAKKVTAQLIKMEDKQHYVTYEYDAKGNITKELSFHLNETPMSHFEYQYDDKNNLVKTTCYDENDGTVSWYCEQKFDENNNLIYYAEHDSDGTISSKYTYEYNDKGQKVKEFCYEDGQEPVSMVEYTYDSHNNPLTAVTLNDGVVYWNTVYEYQYDNSGNMISCKETTNDEVSNWFESTYNANKDRISYTVFNPDGGLKYLHFYKIEYNTEGKMTKHETHTADGVTAFYTVYAYDEYGYLTSEMQYDSSNALISWKYYTYEYK